MPIQPHIILAEDEELVAMALADFLESEGFRVTITHNGAQALEAEEADAADLLLTDMRMPVLDGEGLIRRIRAGRPNLPIIATTGYSDFLPKEVPGLMAVMRKPYSFRALAVCIRALLSAQ